MYNLPPSNLYHITETSNVESILRDGLLPGRPSRFDGYEVEPDKSCVYLTENYNSCPYLAGLGSDDLYTIPGFYSIFWIDADKLNPNLYRPDEDYLRDALNLSEPRLAVEAHVDLWRDSITHHHGSVAYKGVVPAYAILDVQKVETSLDVFEEK